MMPLKFIPPPNRKWVIVIAWDGDDGTEAWVYGPYDHEPTEEEQAAAREEYMRETTTSEDDWDEYGVTLFVTNIAQVGDVGWTWQETTTRGEA